MNDWKKILEQMPEDNGNGSDDEKQFTTTEIHIKAKPKRILGVSPVIFWITLAAVVLVVALGIFMISTMYRVVNAYEGIYPGVVVNNIELGGKSVEEAIVAVEQYSRNAYSGMQLQMTCRGETVTIKAAEVMTVADTSTVVNTAYVYGRDKSILKRYQLIRSNKTHAIDISMTGAVDQAKVMEKIDTLIAAVSQEYKNYSYDVQADGVLILRGSDGVTVNRAALYDTVAERLTNGLFGTLEVEAAVQVSSPPDFEALRETLFVEAQDAFVEKTGARTYRIVNETVGRDINVEKIIGDLNDPDWNEKLYTYVVINPAVTAAFLQENLFQHELANVTTFLDETDVNRTTNVRLSVEAIDQYILLPGETFSFNKVVGERTEAKGYTYSPSIMYGEYVDDIGGGICQTTSTLYWASLMALLKVDERAPHMYVQDYIDMGVDATVQYGYRDYRFTNNTNYPIRILATLEDGALNIIFAGVEEVPGRRVVIRTTVIESVKYETVYRLDETLPVGTEVRIQNGKNRTGVTTKLLVYIQNQLSEEIDVRSSLYSAQNEIILCNPGPA